MDNPLMKTAKQIVNLSNTVSSARLQKAIELFEQGDNKGANAVLNFDEIRADMLMNAQRIDQTRELDQKALEALKSNIEECKLKVRTLKTEKSEDWLQKCIDVYEDVLRNATGRVADDELAELYYDYAVLLQSNRQYEKSLQLYEQNVALCRELAEKAPETYLPHVAQNVGNMACLHSDLQKYDQAENEYAEAISVYKVLVETSPEVYLLKVALNLEFLAILHQDIQKYEQAEKEYLEGISIYKELAEISPEIYSPDVARNIGNLASLHEELNKYEQAEAEYYEAINICSNHLEHSTDANFQCIAINGERLANLHRNQQKYDQAEKEYNVSISLFKDLAEKYPEHFLSDLASGVKNRTLLYESLNRCQEVLSGYQEYIMIYKELAKTNNKYNAEVATGLRKLSHFYFSQGKYELVIPTIDEAIAYDPTNPLLYESKDNFLQFLS